MLGELSVLYLFLGGTGAGCLAVCSLADLLWLREPFGRASCEDGAASVPERRVLALGFLSGTALVVFGVLCLLLDLGKGDRALEMLFSGTFNLMTAGVYGLCLTVALALAATAVRWLYVPTVATLVVRAVEVTLVPAALFVMAYTGFLLQMLGGFALWKSPLLPALFVLSSASCGMATVSLACLFVRRSAGVQRLGRVLAAADGIAIVLEAAAAGAFLALAGGSGHGATQAACANLVSGEQALLWWGGFAVCGMAPPLALEGAGIVGRLRAARRRRTTPASSSPAPLPFATGRTATARGSEDAAGLPPELVAAAVLVLVGGVCLRFAVTGAAEQPSLELQDAILSQGLSL